MFRLYLYILEQKNITCLGEAHHGEGGFAMMMPLVLLAVGRRSRVHTLRSLCNRRWYAARIGILTLQFSILPFALGLAVLYCHVVV